VNDNLVIVHPVVDGGHIVVSSPGVRRTWAAMIRSSVGASRRRTRSSQHLPVARSTMPTTQNPRLHRPRKFSGHALLSMVIEFGTAIYRFADIWVYPKIRVLLSGIMSQLNSGH